MNLIGRADLFWEGLEDTLRRRHEPPITGWLEMKDALSRNYLPPTYRSSLLEEWDRLKQGIAPVVEYIEKFKEFKRRIRIVEEKVVTLNRFKKGLNANLLGEIITRGVTTLRLCLVGRVEKWEDRKLWKDRKVGGWKIFSFPSCVFGWRSGKLG